MRVLALSSSRVANGGYLEAAVPFIRDFLGAREWKVAFIPFASVEKNYEAYHQMVQKALSTLPYKIQLVAGQKSAETLRHAEVIMVGGGNTFKLLHDLYRLDLLDLIKEKLRKGTSYIGWSAGSNIAGLTIGTTNDMPIIQPESFKSLGVLPFQVNPHYLNEKREGFHGETRDERLGEYVKMNPGVNVIGLPEGTALCLEGSKLEFVGTPPATLFRLNELGIIEQSRVSQGQDISFLVRD